MRGIGVLEDGFVFSEEALERGSPRFWWGRRKRAAYDGVLARRGMSGKRKSGRDVDDDTGLRGSDERDRGTAVGTAAAAAVLLSEAGEKKAEDGRWGSWGGGGDSGGLPDGGGGSSDSGGGSGGSGSGK